MAAAFQSDVRPRPSLLSRVWRPWDLRAATSKGTGKIKMQTAAERSPDRNSTRGPHRVHNRSPFSMPLQLRPLYGHPVHGMSLDISEGGVGALVQGRLRVGEAVQIDLSIGTHALTTMAIVKHVSDARAGLQFLRLTASQIQEIAQLVGSA